jgi:hypothetical protein
MIENKVNEPGRIKREKDTIYVMMQMYCRDKHNTEEGLCSSCNRLHEYSIQRINKCTYGLDKPACEVCPVHCFKKDAKEQIKVVMRYAGPRMTFQHPWMAVMHIFDKIVFKIRRPQKKIKTIKIT